MKENDIAKAGVSKYANVGEKICHDMFCVKNAISYTSVLCEKLFAVNRNAKNKSCTFVMSLEIRGMQPNVTPSGGYKKSAKREYCM